jgi:hypothetical protein
LFAQGRVKTLPYNSYCDTLEGRFLVEKSKKYAKI